jgi:hypothetical protein
MTLDFNTPGRRGRSTQTSSQVEYYSTGIAVSLQAPEISTSTLIAPEKYNHADAAAME